MTDRDDMKGTLVRVVAPHFVAGLVIEDGRCVRAAPILRWTIGRQATELRDLFARKRWRVIWGMEGPMS